MEYPGILAVSMGESEVLCRPLSMAEARNMKPTCLMYDHMTKDPQNHTRICNR